MITKVYENIYRNEIPLPNNPLRALNSYIVIDGKRALVIDTGFNQEECRAAFVEGIKELGLELDQIDLLITHLHSDHSGLAGLMGKEGAKVYAGAVDGKMINEMVNDHYWQGAKKYIPLFDLKKDKVSFDDHPGYLYSPKVEMDFTPLKEGDQIKVGEYVFDAIDIPGHTPGHIGLYEKKHKLFFGGDHILNKITPNIAFWGFEQDILAIYFESLQKVYAYDIDYLFTSHRSIVCNHRERIQQLLEHHQSRLDEIRKIIETGEKTVRDTAALMHWELRYEKWEDFPNPQKWFATGEAMSHLEHLVALGELEKRIEEDVLYYRKKQ